MKHARRWLQLDPLHEPAHQAIIRLHGWAGQRSAAMGQYRSLVRVLDRELAVRPLPETTKLYDEVRAGRLAPPPAAAARPEQARPRAGRRPSRPGLEQARPEQPSAAGVWPLVGRDGELAALRAAWQADRPQRPGGGHRRAGRRGQDPG